MRGFAVILPLVYFHLLYIIFLSVLEQRHRCTAAFILHICPKVVLERTVRISIAQLAAARAAAFQAARLFLGHSVIFANTSFENPSTTSYHATPTVQIDNRPDSLDPILSANVPSKDIVDPDVLNVLGDLSDLE